MFKNNLLLNLIIAAILTILGSFHSPVTLADNSSQKLKETCPKDIETLVNQLLKDLPSYTNRVIQRNTKFKDSLPLYIILAGKPEFEPLPTGNQQYQSSLPDTTKQVFFTTSERQYLGNRAVITQNYHWLFLAPTEQGWGMVMLLSRFGSTDKDKPPAPPLEANNSMLGQAIKLWLRDCSYQVQLNLERTIIK